MPAGAAFQMVFLADDVGAVLLACIELGASDFNFSKLSHGRLLALVRVQADALGGIDRRHDLTADEIEGLAARISAALAPHSVTLASIESWPH